MSIPRSLLAYVGIVRNHSFSLSFDIMSKISYHRAITL